MLTRRQLLSGVFGFSALPAHAARRRATKLLVHGGWRSDNTADLAQASGLIALLQRELPSVKLTLWTREFSTEAQAWLEAAFPKLAFVTGTTGTDGSPDDGELAKAWKNCDFLLHGTGGGVLAPKHLRGWKKHAGKPFGLYGVTLPKVDEKLKELLSAAKFLFLRDGISKAEVMRSGIAGPLIDFVPDAIFNVPLAPDPTAVQWLAEQGLNESPFICVVPRLRRPPYWEMFGRPATESEQPEVEENNRFKISDHQILVDSLVAIFQKSELKVLALGEMPHEIALVKEVVKQALPEKWQSRVIVRESVDLPNFTATCFGKASMVVSLEHGSALLAVAVGTLALHIRLPADDSRGQFWRDIGLKDWILEVGDLTTTKLSQQILSMLDDRAAQTDLMDGAKSFVRNEELKVMGHIREILDKDPQARFR